MFLFRYRSVLNINSHRMDLYRVPYGSPQTHNLYCTGRCVRLNLWPLDVGTRRNLVYDSLVEIVVIPKLLEVPQNRVVGHVHWRFLWREVPGLGETRLRPLQGLAVQLYIFRSIRFGIPFALIFSILPRKM